MDGYFVGFSTLKHKIYERPKKDSKRCICYIYQANSSQFLAVVK